MTDDPSAAADQAPRAQGSDRQALAFLDALPVGVGVWDGDGRLRHANPVLVDLLGLVPGHAPDLLDVTVADERDETERLLEELRDGSRNSLQCRLAGAPALAAGAPWPLDAFVTLYFGPSGEPGGFLAQVFDFRPADGVHSLPSGLVRVLEQGADILLVVEGGSSVTYANRSARLALGLPDTGAPSALDDLLEADSRELFDSVVAPKLVADGSWQGEMALQAADGHTIPVSASFVAHGHAGPSAAAQLGRRESDPGDDERPARELLGDLSVFARDITELKNAERRLRQLATHDYLTGLPNRLLLYDRLELALNRFQRYGTPVALLFCDLDGFKPVNDRYGHQVGDTVLVEVADRIHSVVRDTDTAARVGGDEFAVLIEGVDDLELLTTVADRLVARVAEPVEVGAIRAEVGISIGLVVASPSCTEVDGLVALADSAMYRAKAEGRGRYVVVLAEDAEGGDAGRDEHHGDDGPDGGDQPGHTAT
jgi:diguanylate cyclase (GGDEF)-like protein